MNSVRGFLNRRFKLSFWSLLGQRPKVTRSAEREIPYIAIRKKERPAGREGRSFQRYGIEQDSAYLLTGLGSLASGAECLQVQLLHLSGDGLGHDLLPVDLGAA